MHTVCNEYSVHVREVSADVRGKLMSFLLWCHVRGKHMSNRVRDKMIYYRLYEKLYAYTVSARHVRARCHVRNLSADFVRHDQFSAFLVSPPSVAQSGGCVRQFGIDRCCSLIFPHLEPRPGTHPSDPILHWLEKHAGGVCVPIKDLKIIDRPQFYRCKDDGSISVI